MSLTTFIAGLLPSFSKNDVVGKIRNITKKINDIIKDELYILGDAFEESHYKSAFAKQWIKDLAPLLPSGLRSKPNPFVTVAGRAADNATKLLDLLDQYIGKNTPNGIHVEGMTYQKASALRLIELIDFFADYTSRHVHFLVASETDMVVFGHSDGNPLTPDALRYLQSNRASYLAVLNLLNADPKKTMQDLEKIPEIMVADADVSEVPALAGASADPLRLNAIPIISDLFHWVGVRLVDWDIERYEAAKKERRDIELRIESLRQKQGGNLDTQNEVVINGYERELTLARQKIKEMEAKDK